MTETTEPKKPRRGKGEGTIAKVKGRELWCARITVGRDANGKRTRKTVYGKTRKEVADELTKLRNKQLNGTLTATTRQTVGEFLTNWLADSVQQSVRERTHENYRQNVEKHIRPVIGGIVLDRLTPAHVQSLLAKMEQGKKSGRTRQLVFGILKRALAQAVKWGLIVRNVCEAIERPQARRKEMKVLTAEQAAALFTTIKGDRLESLYVLAVTTGLRQGELLGLEWSDVDLTAGKLSVQRTLYQFDGEFRTGEPKSERSRRMVNLPQMAVEALHAHRRLMMTEGNTGAARVFVMPDGSPVDRTWLYRRHFRDVLIEAELPPIRFHDLRHTAATLLLSEGVHPKVVQERLGHSSIQLTLDTYSHVLPTLQEDAAGRLERLFGKVGG